MPLAPIALFCFNRPWHVQQTIESLQRNPLAKESLLYIFSDGPRNAQEKRKTDAVRAYIGQVGGFKNVVIQAQEHNLGLANSVIAGVSAVIQKHGSVVVMEDDLLCTTDFLDYINKALTHYENTPSILSVTGFLFPIAIPASYSSEVCVLPRPSSLGWATWLPKWQKADFSVPDFKHFMADTSAQTAFNVGGEDLTLMLLKQQMGVVNSWAVRWAFAHFQNNAYCLYPVRSKIQHIGADGTGSETGKTDKLDTVIYEGNIKLETTVLPNAHIISNLQLFFKQKPHRRLINYWKYFRKWQQGQHQ